MSVLSRIEKSGFSIDLDDATLVITPPTLSETQVEFIREYKQTIIKELQVRELEVSSAGNDVAPANADRLLSREYIQLGLPSDLHILAVRFCAEVYEDGHDAIAEMINDLLNVPDDWNWWRNYFKRKLEIPPELQCAYCQHCEAAGGNLGRCRKGIHGPGASNLWWMTHQHSCTLYSAIPDAT